MTVKGCEVDLNFEGQIGCYRVAIAETVVLPPRSENIVHGKVRDCNLTPQDIGLIEPLEEFSCSKKGLIGRTLVHGDAFVPVRVMNVSLQPQTIQTGTVVATFSPVEEVKTKFVSDMITEKIPKHLEDLYEKSTKGLEKDQAQQIQNLMFGPTD